MGLFISPEELEPLNEVSTAKRRLTTRMYISRTQPAPWGRDKGQPSRYVRRVFDEKEAESAEDWEWTVDVFGSTPGGRKQFQLHVAREDGAIREIKIQKVSAAGDRLEEVLHLDRRQSKRFLDTIRVAQNLPVDNGENERIDDDDLRAFLEDPSAAGSVYRADPEAIRALIQSDASADDVIALQRRRDVVEMMRKWTTDSDAFEEASRDAGGSEHAWQRLLEDNPWILGIGLGGQLFTAWDKEKLEQVVVGSSIATPGKRPDAVLRTSGIIRSMVFAEIKHHETPLLQTASRPYRSGAWAPSNELSGAAVQAQQTAHWAVKALEEYLPDTGDDGARLSNGTYVIRPRSFVVIGSLQQLTGSGGGVIEDKYRSFELFRRNLHEPEIITFDELLARAEWHVEMAERSAESGDDRRIAKETVDGDDWGDPWTPTGSDPWNQEPPF